MKSLNSYHSSPRSVLLLFTALSLALPTASWAQSAEVLLHVVQNDGSVGGAFVLALQARQSGVGTPTVASGTLDIVYDDAVLTHATPFLACPNASVLEAPTNDGYAVSESEITTGSGDPAVRLTITSQTIRRGTQFPGHDLASAYETLCELTFTIDQLGQTTLTIDPVSANLSFYDTQGNTDGDNTTVAAQPAGGDLPLTLNNLPDAPLPVELVSFEARSRTDTEVELTWATVSETNNAGFEIERRGDLDEGWMQIGFVEGYGTTLAAQSYRFVDEALPFETAKLVYRLKQVDFDGAFQYSPEMEVSLEAPQQFTLHAAYPNPFNPQTTIGYTVPVAQRVKLEVFNLLGQRVAVLVDGHEEAGRHTVRFDGNGLASGLYLYRLETGSFVETQQMTLLK